MKLFTEFLDLPSSVVIVALANFGFALFNIYLYFTYESLISVIGVGIAIIGLLFSRLAEQCHKEAQVLLGLMAR